MMRVLLGLTLCAASFNQLGSAILRNHQPIVEAGTNTDGDFAVAAGDKPGKPAGYRSAWDDCGGVGASATERMRTIAAKVKGWAKPVPFKRHAAQDCGTLDGSGTKPGPGERLVYPGIPTSGK